MNISCATPDRSANWYLYGDLVYNGNTANTNVATVNISGSYPNRCVLSIDATRTFTINPGGGPVDLILAPRVAGTGFGVIKAGAGKLVLTHTNNTYTGPTVVNAGTLLVNGILAGSSVVTNYATFGGTGLVNCAVNVLGGTLAPGYLAAGQFTLGNNVTFTNAGSTNAVFQVELGGPTPGTDYDQLVMTSQSAKVIVTNTTLNLSLANGFVPAADSTFTIIDNQGTNAIQGTFSGLPPKSVFTVGSTIFQISYAAGTGNDVVLTVRKRGSLILVR